MKPLDNPVFVTKPLLPPMDDVAEGIRRIYASGVVTNMGPLHTELENRLHAHLGGESLLLYTNGTIALMAALATLDLPLGSEVITTPFSFAATAHVIEAVGLKPVFADVDATFMNLDPAKVEEAITAKTSCILAVHVYGYPCDVDGLERVAKEHGLRLVFDAAHAFGLQINGRNIAEFGDASAFSLHATKLFNSIEGGALVLNNRGAIQPARDYRNFGIRSEEHVASVGINGKMSEFHALVGLRNLDGIDSEMARRQIVSDVYDHVLGSSNKINIVPFPSHITRSLQYYPIRIPKYRDHTYETLKQYNVFSRRYFYPLMADFDCYKHLASAQSVPTARTASEEVLCLPFYGELDDGRAETIARLVADIVDRAH